MTIAQASVVLPVYNQAEHIGAVLREYADLLGRLPFPFELIAVVNGPERDRSLEICRLIEAERPCVRTFHLQERGWGRAVRFGLAQARGDLLCYTNCARTTAENLLIFLMFGSVHSNSVVKANRRIREGIGRRTGSLLYNLECRALFDLPYWDVNGTPKVFWRTLTPLLALSRDDDLIDLEFNVTCREQNYRVIELPIISDARRSHGSTTTWRSALRLYRGAWRLHQVRALGGRTRP